MVCSVLLCEMFFMHLYAKIGLEDEVVIACHCLSLKDMFGSKEQNIGNYGYIDTWILRIYRKYL